MTKPVAVFRSGLIKRLKTYIPPGSMKTAIWCYFPLSAGIYITSWVISATWPVEASRS
jgi:hypothetical protein